MRFLSIFFILILLINPKFLKKNFETIKPRLLVAVDNSSSIKFASQDTVVTDLIDKLDNDRELNDKFEIDYFTFGDQLQNTRNYSFQEHQTNIFEALNGLNKLVKRQISPIILISDGNQTYGNDYKYFMSKQPVFPMMIGDTIQFSDLKIDRINVNTYTFLNNNFPVEVFINYSGENVIQTEFILEKDNKIIYSQKIKLSNEIKSKQLQFNLPASKVGRHLYKARIETFKNEQNIQNNIKNFVIEVIDEQTNIAIVYDVLHPDIGMYKRSIETNKQRRVNLINLNKPDPISKDIDNNIFILYQPTRKFQEVIEHINNNNSNTFIITGKHTDWNFLNEAQNDFKKISPLTDEFYYPVYNKSFSTFYTEEIGFADFPPLEDSFGEIKFYNAYNTLLTKKINGVNTNNPLLVTFSEKATRSVALFGENSWKWRVVSFNSEQSFEEFDQFLNSIIQFLSTAGKKRSLEVNHKSFYYADEPIKITAKSYDSNLNFDLNAQLEFILDGNGKAIPFFRVNNYYEMHLSDLKNGEYNFSVINKITKEKQKGTFSIAEYAIEQEVLSANTESLSFLANNSNGQSFYPTHLNDLRQILLSDKKYSSIQKENKKMISLIDWKWLLSIIILSLSLEWLIRKYRGLI